MSVLDTEDELLEPPVAPPETPPPSEEVWRVDKNGNQYVPRTDGRSGVIRRQGDETIEQARERDSNPKDQAPKRKPKKPKMPPAPRKVDLKALEEPLAAALKAPGAVAMSFGDEWAFEHFNMAGPYLARQLVLAAEYNPWLRRRLEEAASGEEAMMKVMGMMAIGGAVVMYFVPPTIYFLNLPVPEQARAMMHVPPRRERQPAYASPQTPPGTVPTNGSFPA